MYEQFKANAEGAGNTEVRRFGLKSEALAFIEDILTKEDVGDAPGSYAVWAESPFLSGTEREALAVKYHGLTFQVTRELSKGARVGITRMDWGIADTGTLVQDSTAAEQRLASALPLIHIALLGTGNIVPDLPSVMTKVHPDKSAYIALITGPSKTADIERVLAIGVHGPERLYIACVDELEGTSL
ncbi:MAG TPA: lactate utilization protein [Geobacteraceae bacterium]|nr:lactate utilization protein [Geobacteraceae bacterium]